MTAKKGLIINNRALWNHGRTVQQKYDDDNDDDNNYYILTNLVLCLKYWQKARKEQEAVLQENFMRAPAMGINVIVAGHPKRSEKSALHCWSCEM